MWNLTKNKTLFCQKGIRQEAVEYGKHATGVFKSDSKLSTELSNLIDYFLGNTTENCVSAVVVSQRKREVVLAV